MTSGQTGGRPLAVSAERTDDRAAQPLRRIPPPQPVRRASPAPKFKVQPPKANVEPESIEIPALGIDQDLTELAVIGTDLQVPDDYFDVGWWRGGPTPGEKGASVIVGHVDSPTGPAVFYQLSGLRAGHEITVGLDDGSRAMFVVRRVQAYERTQFPSAKVYRAAGKPGLNLLTCGGSFDADAGQYASNVVVFTDLVERIPAKSDKRKPAKTDTQGPARADKQAPARADKQAPAQADKQAPAQDRKAHWYQALMQDSRRKLAQKPERFERLIQTSQARLEDESGQRR